jgi:hypothetical protein
MAFNVGNNLNLNNYELQNVLLQKLAADPSPIEAKIYFNTVSNVIRFHNGTSWESLSTSSGTGDVVGPASSVDNQIALFDLTTGKLLKAATTTGMVKATSGVISAGVAGTDYTTPSSTESFTNKTFDANGTGNSISNIEVADLAAGVLNTSTSLAGATDSQVPSALAVKTYADNVYQGIKWKQEVRVATIAAGTLASDFENGDSVDGVVLSTGDRILIKNQASATENGIYTVNASGAPTRATDADTGAELKQAAVFVSEGTVNADNAFVNTTDGTITLGATNITFVSFSSATVPAASTTVAGKVELADSTEAEAKSSSSLALTPASVVNFPVKKTFTIGDTAATSFALTHNLNTLDVVVSIRKVSTGEQWLTDITANSVNQVTIVFGVAPSTNEFVVTVIG